MNIRRFLFTLALCLSAVCAFSQSISDEQVLQILQKEIAAGTSQQNIITKLMRRGVTVEQLQRVRRKYATQQELPGAVDDPLKPKTRTRTRQSESGYMVSVPHEGSYTAQERQEWNEGLADELTYLMGDSIVPVAQEDMVFGRNIFNNENLTFEPNMNMATPSNYRLGAGDNVIIDIWGASQQTFSGEISPDGTVTIEGVGPIKLSGLSVAQANTVIKSRLGEFYSGCSMSLTVGDTRTIIVQVMGEVVAPGTYTLSSLSSAFNALYAAGGISDIGTLRNIKVYRAGTLISTIDVYDYILNGNVAGDVRLQDNDIIVVDAYDCLVCVRGKVKRPMYYEMKSTETVKQVLKYAGGFSGDAYTKNVTLTRKSGVEYSIHTIDEFQMGAFTLSDKDSLYVDSVIPRFSNMVEVSGAVMHPGKFQLNGDIQTVRELILAADGLREDAYQSHAVMHRTKDDLTLQMVNVDLEGILAGTVPDIPLKKNDVLYVPSSINMQGEQTLTIRGEVVYPGVYQYASSTTVEDLILQAGGLTQAATLAKVDVYRRIRDEKALERGDNAAAETYSFTLNEDLRVTDSTFTLMPYDEVYVRKSPAYMEQQRVKVEGCVNFVGTYVMATDDYRLTDLVKAAGGLTHLGYAPGARLIRRMTQEEKDQREAALRASQIQMYEEALRNEKNYDLNYADTLLTMKMDLGDTYPVAVNLEKAMNAPGGSFDVVLREGDRLVIPLYSNTVKVSGEVMYPISMNYKKGAKVGYYIRRAGGFSNHAAKKHMYAIYMNGSVEQVGRNSRKIQPGSEVVVPTKSNTKKISAAELMTIGTSTISVATMIVTLLNIIKK